MIVELQGELAHVEPGYVVVVVQGIGFGVYISRETQDRLPARGQPVHLYTHLWVREDQWRLIGFHSLAEREVFLDLLSVDGVGLKGALSVLSQLGVHKIRQAVREGDWRALKAAPGIGPKTAQRIHLELSHKWKGDDPPRANPELSAQTGAPGDDDVVGALVTLGYREAEAWEALRQISATDPAERLKLALKALDRARR